jgi:Xaa-Pro aminopeptidase
MSINGDQFVKAASYEEDIHDDTGHQVGGCVDVLSFAADLAYRAATSTCLQP